MKMRDFAKVIMGKLENENENENENKNN